MSLDRRRFLGQVALSVSGVALSGPSLAEIAPASLLGIEPACPASASAYADACGDWTVDDMCGAYPPYAFNTGASQPHTVPLYGAGADHHWIS
ncbi:MAG: hypothetical protein ABI616_13380 [Pseudomonadota bacterium]